MCGVVGYLGYENKVAEIVQITKRLEYRGYDSAGIHATLGEGFFFYKDVGSIDNIKPSIFKAVTKISEQRPCNIISHTRWATSSPVTQANAHPHNSHRMHIVHNGIFHLDFFKNILAPINVSDTKNFINLVASSLEMHQFHFGTKEEAIPKILADIVHHQDLGDNVALMKDGDIPDKLFILITGNKKLFVSENGFVCSDLSSLSGFAKKAKILKAGIYSLELRNGHKILYRFIKSSDTQLDKRYLPFMFDTTIPKCDFDNIDMLTEIHEQANVELHRDDYLTNDAKVNLIGCGSSYNAAQFAWTLFHYLPSETKMVHVYNGNEYLLALKNTKGRFLEDLVDSNRNIFITQSGTTHDIVSCMDILEKDRRLYDVITNNPQNVEVKSPFNLLDLKCGPEFAVAATKTFTKTVLELIRFFHKKALTPQIIDSFKKSLNSIFLDEKNIKKLANSVSKYSNILILGSKTNYPIALEAALKLKEVSYIHAEGMLGSEIKHGPIALIDDKTLSIILMNNDPASEEIKNNADEIKARGGKRLFVVTNSDYKFDYYKDDMFININSFFEEDNEVTYALQSLLINVSLQLLSYYIAKEKGINPNMPRHLAKSVTV